jgi:hypothetical protein
MDRLSSAARTDTEKARAAVESGVTLLAEAELFPYIEAGHIPPRLRHRQADLRNPTEQAAFSRKVASLLPFALAESEQGEWEITWCECLQPPRNVILRYEDFEGNGSERNVVVIKRGKRADGVLYWGATDAAGFKTFREDRIADFSLSDRATLSDDAIQREPSLSLRARFRSWVTAERN